MSKVVDEKYGTCDCCLKKDNVYKILDYLRVDGLNYVCDKCSEKAETKARYSFGEKSKWQIYEIRAQFSKLRSEAEKKKEIRHTQTKTAIKIIRYFLNLKGKV